MLTRIIASFAALAVIGLAAIVAALPITAQSDGDSPISGASAPTATATATPTATQGPGPTSFNLTPHIDNLGPNGLTRIGDKWYVSGFHARRVFIFSDNGTYERSFPISGCEPHDIRGMSTDGNGNLVAASGLSQSAIYTWPPPADAVSGPSIITILPLPASPSGRYLAHGVAHDRDSTIWVAACLAERPQHQRQTRPAETERNNRRAPRNLSHE